MKENKIQGGLHKSVINWYPGHMVKAQNEIKENLKLIDIVVEILDARIPISSQNPLVKELSKNKERIVVLNKADLADEKKTKEWMKYFEKSGILSIPCNSSNTADIKKIINAIKSVGEKIYKKKNENKAIKINPIYRVLIIGIPNVGKSTLINKISGKNSAMVGNKPGVTKKKQWIRVGNNIDLLDTPGLLWPNLGDKQVGIKLALTGNIKQEILDVEDLACNGIDFLREDEEYKKLIIEKYNLQTIREDELSYDLLEKIGKKRGCLISGGNVDMQKASKCFLDDLKNGKIGKITYDKIEEET